MRAIFKRGRAAVGAGALAAALALTIGACGGNDECNHVIKNVPDFSTCQAIGVERVCSSEIVYRPANEKRSSAWTVKNCGDCPPPPTPTAVPEPEEG